MNRLALVLIAGWLLLSTPSRGAAVWQWSVPAPTIPDRRAFLWVPPDCRHVRGLVVACQNMLEKPLFERPAFRAACAENDLGIVMIFSGHDHLLSDDQNPDHPPRSYLDIFLNPDFQWGKSTAAEENPRRAGEDLQKVLDALAQESGYPEIARAPLMPVGHSSAGSFVWHLYRWDPARIFAMLPLKTPSQNDGPQGIPILFVNSEWFDYGNNANDCSSRPAAIATTMQVRANGTNSQFGYYIDLGSGHCNVSDDSIPIIAQFLKTVVAARIPTNPPPAAPVTLNAIKPEAGWLLDPAMLGLPQGKPIAYADWPGDPRQALWYPSRELAAAVQSHMAEQRAKQSQFIGFVQDDEVYTSGGIYHFSPRFRADGETFALDAKFLEHLTDSDLVPPDRKLSHSDSPIQFRVNSGALVQVGSNTFRVCPHGGPIGPQGNPWEPVIVAYNPGDQTFRPTEHPAHVNIDIINRAGETQTLDFAQLTNQPVGVKSLKLSAKASSGLPVEFFVVSGPAVVDGDTLKFTAIPARAKFPVRVIVSAFQWGRSMAPPVPSAGPVTQEFWITR